MTTADPRPTGVDAATMVRPLVSAILGDPPLSIATLRAWIRNLEERWDDAVAIVGEGRARVWRLYMAGSALGFEDGGLGLHQVLGVVPTAAGEARMPRTRDGWTT